MKKNKFNTIKNSFLLRLVIFIISFIFLIIGIVSAIVGKNSEGNWIPCLETMFFTLSTFFLDILIWLVTEKNTLNRSDLKDILMEEDEKKFNNLLELEQMTISEDEMLDDIFNEMDV